MSMGRRNRARQEELWIPAASMSKGRSHPFYSKLNAVLEEHGFDEFVESNCAKFYAEVMGRPSVAPGVYFRMLLIGYFEGIDSERGISWRAEDSKSLHEFLGYPITESVPDHSTLSRTRRLMDLETHAEVFVWVEQILAKSGLIQGKTAGVDATTLEANAAMRSIVRRDTRESYEEFLTRLAQASGIATPTREDLAKLDKKRPNKGSNLEWEHPLDPDARIAKMKDGRTHLAHKAEHAVDLETGALLAVTLQGADEGDPATLGVTLLSAVKNMHGVCEDQDARSNVSKKALSEPVLDKGYHSNDSLVMIQEVGMRSYASEPDRGGRRWKGNACAQRAVYGNRRRIRGARGKALLRKRGELVERSFAHMYDTGAMRRTHLRGRGNILKRLLVHGGAFNLGLLMRKLLGHGTPRGHAERLAGVVCAFLSVLWRLRRPFGPTRPLTPLMPLLRCTIPQPSAA